MTTIKPKEFTGYSETGLDDAIKDALKNVEGYQRIEVIETKSSHLPNDKRHFQVTLATHFENA